MAKLLGFFPDTATPRRARGRARRMASTKMAKKKMGRPKSERQDVSIKFDKVLAGKARLISQGRGVSMAEYLTEMTKPLIDRDYARLMRELEERDARATDDSIEAGNVFADRPVKARRPKGSGPG